MSDLREYVRESNAIEGVYEESAVEETLEAWEFLREQGVLTHESVKHAHKLIMWNREPNIAGIYGDQRHQVYVDSGRPPHPVAIEPKMETLFSWSPANQLEAIKWHIAFEQIHPFPDGNGRIGRLLYRWHCTELDVAPLIWRESDREAYLALVQSSVDLERANDGDRE